jgi:hypothetical protein
MKISLFAVLFFVVAVCSLNAQVPNDVNNGSFEEFVVQPDGTVDVNNWVSSGVPPKVYHAYTATRNDSFYQDNVPNPNAIFVPIEPNEGQYFLRLESYCRFEDPYCPNWTQLTQIIEVNDSECIRGVYYFDAEDYMGYNDSAMIRLVPFPEDPCSGLAEIVLAKKSISEPHISNFGGMLGWETFSHTFDSNDAGIYMLILEIVNGGDRALPSYLLVDALEIVPAPSLPACNYILTGDMNDDCKVDFADFAMMAANWLVDCDLTPEACTHK